ncbi:MAG: tRNA (adenosine(37)-N6)-threonylcarbamoyltransferase complex dimerization subunit type 1 TsaB [Candidatus Scalindua sp. AMX11]|nr:MAG: tRNA (adenosine(37)-N6)-threonylcarbamoyltransferase complex dimerization subunit type 1 TsaB [Candidatus Scalindua sp.]NOG84799.1 tRNA (adenosine(37)-N6)-threonylcarbamoyltransferase complex dimerization subunit type 1 TsaB [Planctomycetota bacterium]RZV98399.1 MAG: tRNA (adenosine(37)-N6)-threonylcarbamoyltransferase complex dimerization subunit type 1 TsaB [Candidatus Scalindua sp. SCAELEC01]TDE66505.1 MAG: tRNA (adenosine(37)-N6)-threonylcarbamoyltransferase complex dimerization subu
MKVIGIETSGAMGSVCLCDNDTIVGTKTFGKSFGQGKDVGSSLNSLFQEMAWTPQDIDLIAVSIGPGSYTGLRVGVTCAKTLAYSLNKPVIDVPTLDVLAENVKSSVKTFCPVIDAKRKSIYACIYERNGSAQKRITGFLLIPPKDLLDILPDHTLLFGDGITPYKDIFTQKNLTLSTDVSGIANALNVAKLGLKRYEQGERCDMETLEPLYLRRSEAEERLM